MNTTRNVSIGGYAFIIEDDAYLRLSAYTQAVRNNLGDVPGKEEMMFDIETHIADTLRATMKGREVVVSDDITLVIERMGDPDVYLQEDSASGKGKKESGMEDVGEKRLHRDPNNKILSGVCGGLAAYFNVDPVWIRLGFVALAFLYSAGFLIYIILWIVIPVAKTRLQQLQMRGRTPNLKNIEDSIRSEISGVGQSVNKLTNSNSVRDGANRAANALGDVFAGIFQVIVKILQASLKVFAALIAVSSLSFLVLLVFMAITGTTSIHVSGDEVNVDDMSGVMGHLFDSPWESFLFTAFLFIFLAIPAISLLATSIRFLADAKTKTPKWLTLAAVGVWLISTSYIVYSGIKLGFDFTNSATGKEEFVVPTKEGQTLRLRLGDVPQDTEGFLMSDINLQIHQSQDSSFVLRVNKEAAGRTESLADRRQRSIIYKPIITDTVITFPELYILPKGETVRAQAISMELLVPRNARIFIEDGIQRFLDVDNVQNIHDSEMSGQYWIMTELGLSCENCPVPKRDSIPMFTDSVPVPIPTPKISKHKK